MEEHFARFGDEQKAFVFAMGYFAVLMPPLMILWWRAHAHAEATTLASAAR